MKFFAVAVLVFLVVAQSLAEYNYRNSEEMRVSDEAWSTSFLQSSSHHQESSVVRSFKKKISQRLAGSETFSNNPQFKERVIQVAEEKLEKCQTPSGENYDSHCVGRALGQVMQLIGTVENTNKHAGNHYSHGRQNQWKDSSEY
uniref:Uncharacterized protein n=1 Tax=Musca domestica TaxID=7370 RepID=A0A1I8NJT9_MUSDO